MTDSKILLALLMIWLSASRAFAADHYVSPSGVASWANSTDIAQPCSLSTANSNVAAGDTVYLRGGDYGTRQIKPTTSGTAESRITFAAYTGETPEFNDAGGSTISIWIIRDYITIRGVTVNQTGRHLLVDGANYVELDSCVLQGEYNVNPIKVYDVGASADPSTHFWMHDCTIAVEGHLTAVAPVDDGGGMQIGVPGDDRLSGNATIENCHFEKGGHHNLETYGANNVIRNNTWLHANQFTAPGDDPEYAPDDNGKWGNRHYQAEFQHATDGPRNLIEGNRFGPSGTPPDDDGGDQVSMPSRQNIFRYNTMYGAQNNGLLLKDGGAGEGDDNRIYNNTIFAAGRYDNTNGGAPVAPYTGAQWQGAAIRYYTAAITDNLIKNNILYGGNNDDFAGTVGNNAESNNWKNASGDPLFVNPTYSTLTFSASVPDLSIPSNSPVKDGGGALTQAVGAGAASTALTVSDAFYFQDGTKGSALSAIEADWIAVGTVGNVAQISSIDYDTDIITLATPLTWSNSDSVWLYKDSDGDIVLAGTAPDQGAFEYGVITGSLTTGTLTIGP